MNLQDYKLLKAGVNKLISFAESQGLPLDTPNQISAAMEAMHDWEQNYYASMAKTLAEKLQTGTLLMRVK